MTQTKTRKPANELHYIARAQFKATGAILYGVRSGENVYHVTIIRGRVTGCCNATTGEDCKGFTYSKGQCKHAKYVLGLEAERVASEQVAELLPEMAAAGDVKQHVKDSIESHEFDWVDAERAAWANATPDQRRAMYSNTFDLTYGDVA